MKITPPYFGAAYYPEAWPVGMIDQEIPRMKQAGMNVMRMAEFAWIQMEPHPGQFDFDWLHTVVNRLGEAGIASVLGTPSATPPLWLTKLCPEILLVDDTGRPRQHGERCHWCPNQPVYREYVARIVEAMAREFGDDPSVIAWQIDNEPYPNRRGCCCPVCVEKFRIRLKAKFGSIAALNSAWGTNLWSQRYDSFADLEAPRSDIWHHPSLVAEWMRFQSDSYAEFVGLQAGVLRKQSRRLIGCDMMPMHRLNYRDIAPHLDVMMFNHYPHEGHLRNSQFWMSYAQSYKAQPFWVTECTATYSGATAVVREKGYRREGFARVLSWLPVLMGGEAVMYWLWRCHWSGQELAHGAVIESSGLPCYAFDEIASVGKGFAAAAEFLGKTRPVKPRVALHFSCDAALTFEAQRLVDRLQYEDFYAQYNGLNRGELVEVFYTTLAEAQVPVQVIDPSRPLDDFSVVISPLLLSLDESHVRERLLKWIENGGTWVVGPMTDIRTQHGTKYTAGPFSVIEAWTGAVCTGQVTGNVATALFDIRWKDGTQNGGRIWYDVFDLPANAEVLGTYATGRYIGKTAAFSVPSGKGRIVVLGTVPTKEGLLSVLAPELEKRGIGPAIEASRNLLCVERVGGGLSGLAVAELDGKAGRLSLAGRMTDLVSGQVFAAGVADIEPYRVLVLMPDGDMEKS